MSTKAFLQGIEEFNRREFYACHDTLEAIWLESSEPHRQFYQGILQIAVACYHLENCNWRGAVTLLGEGTRRIRDYQPDYEEIDVARLFAESLELLGTLQQIAPEEIASFRETLHSQNTALGFPQIVAI